MHDLHVTGGSTLCWYYLYDCVSWDWYNNSDCDCQHGWNIILSYLMFETRCCTYVSFLQSSFFLISANLISVCIPLHEWFAVSLIGEFAVP